MSERMPHIRYVLVQFAAKSPPDCISPVSSNNDLLLYTMMLKGTEHGVQLQSYKHHTRGIFFVACGFSMCTPYHLKVSAM